jgi:hypothetical protein
MSTELVKSVLRKGDYVLAYGGESRAAELSGEITSIGRVNVKLFLRIRWSPDGPWHKQTHTVPIREIKVIIRVVDDKPKTLLDLRKKAR